MKSFETRVPGKWVLAGEHAVLRGSSAVALPLSEFALTLRFQAGNSGSLSIVPSESRPLLQELITTALEIVAPGTPPPSGELMIQSTIPQGAGLGSSAALCAAITKWLAGAHDIPLTQWPEIARRLENRFHGQSSGMDVSVILAEEPISFSRATGATPLHAPRLPRFTFHDTGLRASTRECIAKVNELAARDPETAARFDHHMAESARLAQNALTVFQDAPKIALDEIAHAMALAQACYTGWGLLPQPVRDLEHELIEKGALACKLTGAGAGGFLVALWTMPGSTIRLP